MQDFKDKVVVITGGASGIGFSFAKQFGKEGAKIVIGSRRTARVDAAVDELKAMGIEAAGITCDVAKREDVEALADFAWATFGKADVLFNNAGVSQKRYTRLLKVDLQEFRDLFEINIYGVLHGIQVFGRRFVEQGTPAAIYNLGSENSLFPAVPRAHAYVASKHSVLAISELLAEEVPDFIDVSVICPGFVQSEMTEGTLGGMDTDTFTGIIMPQLKAGNFFAVSHGHNMTYIDKRYADIKAAYDTYAPRYEGDDQYDARTMTAKMRAKSS